MSGPGPPGPDILSQGLVLADTQGVGARVGARRTAPGGRQLASAGDDQTVRLWDPATGAARTTLTGHDGPVAAVVFSPAASKIACKGRAEAASVGGADVPSTLYGSGPRIAWNRIFFNDELPAAVTRLTIMERESLRRVRRLWDC